MCVPDRTSGPTADDLQTTVTQSSPTGGVHREHSAAGARRRRRAADHEARVHRPRRRRLPGRHRRRAARRPCAKAEEVRPDVVLLDIVMPDLDGIEVMRQLRERRPVAGHPADRQGLDRGQGEGPRPRRRRLHRQAVPSRRARGARPCGPPPLVRRPPGSGRPRVRRRRDRPRAPDGHPGRRAGPARRGPSGCSSSTWPPTPARSCCTRSC